MDKPFNNGLNVFIVVAATFIVQIVLALVISKLTCCTDLGTNLQIAGAICFAIVVIIEYFQHRKRRKAGENIPWWGWDCRAYAPSSRYLTRSTPLAFCSRILPMTSAT